MKTRTIKSKNFVEGRNLKRLCPRCEEYYFGYPALSRKDNKTEICPDCGVKEAMEDWASVEYTGKVYWKQ